MSRKVLSLFSVLLFVNSGFGKCTPPPPVFGILGGIDGVAPFASLVGPQGASYPISAATLPASGIIYTVGINGTAHGIIGGQNGTAAYAALVSPSGVITNLSGFPLPAAGQIGHIVGSPSFGGGYDVAINNAGLAAIGGETTPMAGNVAYAALVDSAGVVTGLSGAALPVSGMGNARILSVSVNNQGRTVIGGRNPGNPPYLGFVDSSGFVTLITGLPSSGFFNAVAINDSGLVLAAGSDGVAPFHAYATLVDASGNLIPITGSSFPPSMPSSQLTGTAINSSGYGLITGGNGMGATPPYAALISPTGSATVIPTTNFPATGFLYSAAINDSGTGIIGGTDLTNAFAAFVSPSGQATPISGLPAPGSIFSVAINEFGTALVGGRNGTGMTATGYAAIVLPTGALISIPGLPTGYINSVAVVKALSQIPTACLTGNNLSFANYINQFAPQDAFYFLPAWFDGTLEDALESAAPTRNAITLFTADNNLLFLSHGLSVHLRNQRHFREHPGRETTAQTSASISMHQRTSRMVSQNSEGAVLSEPEPCLGASEEGVSEEEFVYEKSNQEPVYSKATNSAIRDRPYSLWFEMVGAFASQKKQHQTPGFNPSVGGAVIALDRKTNDNSFAGGGLAYTYTHISEKENAGSSHINQEYLFGYASWMNQNFYFDGVLWAGLFQIHQVRNIHMSGFSFHSISSPKGWQLAPHVEFGYDHTWTYPNRSLDLILDPFVMLDWVNAWQNSYQEHGNSPFNVGQNRHYSSLLRTEVGLRFYQTLFYNTWICTFEEKGSYVNKAPFGVGNMNAFLVGSPGSFTVETLSSVQNLGVVEVSFIAEPVDHGYPYGSLSYQGEFGSGYQSHQGTAEVSWDF